MALRTTVTSVACQISASMGFLVVREGDPEYMNEARMGERNSILHPPYAVHCDKSLLGCSMY